MINDLIKNLSLPPLTDKNTMLDILLYEEYGYLPKHDGI